MIRPGIHLTKFLPDHDQEGKKVSQGTLQRGRLCTCPSWSCDWVMLKLIRTSWQVRTSKVHLAERSLQQVNTQHDRPSHPNGFYAVVRQEPRTAAMTHWWWEGSSRSCKTGAVVVVLLTNKHMQSQGINGSICLSAQCI